MDHQCAVCGAWINALRSVLTAHEYKCYKRHPDMIPEHHAEEYKRTLLWEARSNRAKAAWARRKGR